MHKRAIVLSIMVISAATIALLAFRQLQTTTAPLSHVGDELISNQTSSNNLQVADSDAPTISTPEESSSTNVEVTRTVTSPAQNPTVVYTPVYINTTVTYYTFEVVNDYAHDREAFTQGLVWYDGYLYEGTGLRGRSSLRKVNLEDGVVLQQIALPEQYFGEGITVLNDLIFQLTWQSQIGFIYDRETFAQQESFAYPTEGWGVTHDGQRLIMSDGSARLYFLDPETLTQLGSIDVTFRGEPVPRLNELEYLHDRVYANVWQTDWIVMINPRDGVVTGVIDLQGLLDVPPNPDFPIDVLNGIAYDAVADRLFVTGKLWPKLYEIRLRPAE